MLQIISVNINELKKYKNNNKLHPQKQISKIALSIKKFGFNVPVLVDKENNIIAGHGRLLAAQELKLESVPCIRIEHLSENDLRAYRIADNATGISDFDEEMLKLEFTDLKLADYDLELTGFDIDEIELMNGIKTFPEKEFDENVKVTYKCPKCGYNW